MDNWLGVDLVVAIQMLGQMLQKLGEVVRLTQHIKYQTFSMHEHANVQRPNLLMWWGLHN